MKTWTRYADQKPPEGRSPMDKVVYWWRIPAMNYGGLTLRPEWTDPLVLKSGCHDSWEPYFTRWDGWKWIKPEGLEWKSALDGKERGVVVWPNLHLKPCPFCGAEAKLKANGRYIGAPIYHYEHFDLGCSGCGMVKLRFHHDLKRLVSLWNTRHSHLKAVA